MRFGWKGGGDEILEGREKKKRKEEAPREIKKEKKAHAFSLSSSHLTHPESTPLPTMGSSGSNPFENPSAS